MQNEADEVLVNYFVLCDQVITEAQTSKQSLVGIYSALMGDQMPMQANVAVAFGARVQSATPREFIFKLTGPDGDLIFASPQLPCDWKSIGEGLKTTGIATLQMGLSLRAVPFTRPGIYTATMYCDGSLLATYPVSVSTTPPLV